MRERLSGAIENAGPGNDTSNGRAGKTTGPEMHDGGGAENAGVENAGVENTGVDSKVGKCRSGKCRSDNVWKAVRRENSKIPVVYGKTKRPFLKKTSFTFDR